jgi:hypothetical protein
VFPNIYGWEGIPQKIFLESFFGGKQLPFLFQEWEEQLLRLRGSHYFRGGDVLEQSPGGPTNSFQIWQLINQASKTNSPINSQSNKSRILDNSYVCCSTQLVILKFL